jgi:hypothetical protein
VQAHQVVAGSTTASRGGLTRDCGGRARTVMEDDGTCSVEGGGTHGVDSSAPVVRKAAVDPGDWWLDLVQGGEARRSKRDGGGLRARWPWMGLCLGSSFF